MNQTEKRCWLIKELQTDMPEYGALTIPETPEEQKKLLRSLMNVRPPKPVSQAFLQIQDEYLREESRLRGICDGMTLPGGEGGWAYFSVEGRYYCIKNRRHSKCGKQRVKRLFHSLSCLY